MLAHYISMCNHYWVLRPRLKLLSFLSSSKISLTLCLVYRHGRDGDIHTLYSALAKKKRVAASLLLFISLAHSLYLSLCSTQEQVFRISKTRLPVLWQPRLCEFWYCTNPILFDVSPQGFKGKTGHVGFPGQKVSQWLIALPSHYVCLFVCLQLLSVACALGQAVVSDW